MAEGNSDKSAINATQRMAEVTSVEIGNGYTQPVDFSDAEVAELQRLAAVAWFRLESRELEEMIAEFVRRNSLTDPPVETYDQLHKWFLKQTAHYPIWFGQPVPAIAVFWAYGKAALTSEDFLKSPERIRTELARYISGSEDFVDVAYDDVKPYREREPWREQ